MMMHCFFSYVKEFIFQILQWTNDQNVVQWLEQLNKSTLVNDRIRDLQRQNAREDIRRYVFNISSSSSKEIFFLFIKRLLQLHPDLLSDIIEQSNVEQRQEFSRIINSKTTN